MNLFNPLESDIAEASNLLKGFPKGKCKFVNGVVEN